MNVLLVDLSAKHIHKSAAPWCLKAYCERTVPGAFITVGEYTVNDPLSSVLDGIYGANPDVIGFSCYIWNIGRVREIAGAVKALLPDCVIILGGPEVSFDSEYPFADHIVQGPGEAAFAGLLNGASVKAPPFVSLPTPYTRDYFDSFASNRMLSIKNQLVYYESSRGCPFSCSYCLSSVSSGVEYLPLERVFQEIDTFSANGARIVKFTDRTFNADKDRASAILRHIRTLKTNCAWHFEAAADLFDDELLTIVESMPPGRIQFEIGIQSFGPQTLRAVNRVTDLTAAEANIRKLVSFGNTHIHLDLIAGLPFETAAGFAEGVDRCLSMRPHMLQIGILKLLKGTKLRDEHEKYGYLFNKYPPYQVFSNDHMSFEDLRKIRLAGQTVNRFYNSGFLTEDISRTVNDMFGSGFKFFYELALFFGPGGIRNLSRVNAGRFMSDFLNAYEDTASRRCPERLQEERSE